MLNITIFAEVDPVKSPCRSRDDHCGNFDHSVGDEVDGVESFMHEGRRREDVLLFMSGAIVHASFGSRYTCKVL